MNEAVKKRLSELTTKLDKAFKATSLNKEEAKKIVVDEDADALCVYLSVRELLGEECLAWEPESVWITLDRQGLDIPTVNRDKFNSLSTLQLTPAFYWDADVFSSTVAPLNDHPPVTDNIEEYAPEQIAWAVLAAELFYRALGREVLDLDREPQVYTAVVLYENGYDKPPVGLSFAEEALTAMLKNKAFGDVEDKARHTGVQNYLEERSAACSTCLDRLLT